MKPYASPLIMLEGLIESPGFENQFAPYKARLSLPLKNFPEHLICVAEIDTLRDEGKMYYALLRIFGAEATLHEYPGMFHGFAMANVAFAQSQQCMDDCVEFINKIFYDKK